MRRQTAPAPGGPPYNLLQKYTYSLIVFLALPLMILTGLGMSPAVNAAYPWLSGMFGGNQSARTHSLLCLCRAAAVPGGARRDGRGVRIPAADACHDLGEVGMKDPHVLTSRRTLITGLASAGGLLLAGCSETQPPTYGNVLRMGDLLTYRAQRLLLPRQTLAQEFARGDITSIPAIGTTNPANPNEPLFNAAGGATYERLRSGRVCGLAPVDRGQCRAAGAAIRWRT